jgi:hypothetical protein
MKEYAQCYGPLTVDDALESDGNIRGPAGLY